MALAYHQTQISGRNTSVSVTVPRDNLARLMYYLNSVNSVLAGSPFPSYVTDYRNYDDASKSTKKEIVLLAALFNPNELLGKVFHAVSDSHPQLQGSRNAFIEITAASRQFVVTEAFMVGGHRVQTASIMLCTADWLSTNWEQPIMALKGLLKKKKSCSIQ